MREVMQVEGVTGSSPRMWGTLENLKQLASMRPVHPHACGELSTSIGRNVVCDGSSPRMWGTQCEQGLPVAVRRFIPTHVGNSSRACRELSSRYGSSPRMWGTLCPGLCIASGPGSSPRMWGTHQRDIPKSLCVRFIPTHVGNSPWTPCRCRTPPVHPHACGELRAYWRIVII